MMCCFKECAKKYFNFLKKFGYTISDDANIHVISFVGKNNQVDITFSPISYELTCQFTTSANNNETFSLQDALTYESIEDFRGLYQIASREEMEKGISYLSEAVKILFESIDISDSFNFQKIYKFTIDTHKKLLEQYYVKTDLRKAEDYWKRKEYAKTKELFEENIDYLSKTQLKKLEYIKKQML